MWILLWNNVYKFHLVKFVPFGCVLNEFPSCEYWVKTIGFFSIKNKQPKSEQAKSEQPKSKQAKSEQPKSEQPKSKKPKSEKLKFHQAPWSYCCQLLTWLVTVQATCVGGEGGCPKKVSQNHGIMTQLYISIFIVYHEKND